MLRLALAWLVLAAPIDAQVPLTIRVVDSLGVPVPYAVVDASPGGRRVADSDGVVAFTRLANLDSTLIIVRDRMERVQHGAIVGEFITPEDLDRLSAMTVARALTGEEGMRGATSIDGRATTSRPTGMAPLDVEEMVNGGAIAAIEVYPSTANAPAELQAAAMGGRGSCGIIAFWTGARR